MSFLGKLKSLHSGPPTPPKRIDNDQGYGWPEGEFDDDADQYEAPPCERPVVKVPPRQVEENVYLGESVPQQRRERSSAPEPSRQAPPPRLAKIPPTGKAPILEQQRDFDETYIDPNVKKPPQINREEKPGRKAVPRNAPPSRSGPAPSPSPAPAPCPAHTSNPEDDVYLDPNEGQEGSDELYLEPNAGCPPPPGVTTRKPPPPTILSREAPPLRGVPREAPPPRGRPHEALPLWAGPRDAPPTRAGPREAPPTRGGAREPPMVKPPVPRALSSTHLPAPPEAKRPLFPLPPAVTGIKLQPPTPPKESKPSLPLPSQPDTAAGGLKKAPLSGTEESQLQDKEWFAGNCDRKTAESILSRVKKDGAFLVRYSSAQNTKQPYTLVVLYRQKVYNIPIRYLEHTHGYALGKEGKKNEECFSSLQEIISHHKKKPILLIDSKSQAKHSTHLMHAVHP